MTTFTHSEKNIQHKASQYAFNIAVFVALAILLITPGVIAYYGTVYLENVAGLIPLVGYWYVYDVIKGYFFDS